MANDNDRRLTTNTGAPVPDNQNSETAGARGPVVLEDIHLIEKLAHFDRERIPERVVHAKGAAAHGYFEVTADVSKYTCAAFLSEVGKRTPLFARFSTVGGEKGSADAERDPRGFAVKIYTDEGNYDIVGNNTPVFFIRDAIKFPDFVHTQKRNPQTNLKDADMFWDFLSLTPESVHQVTILFSDRGTPKTYRHMHGFGTHTFKWINKSGAGVWVKYHFRTEAGIKNLTNEEAIMMGGLDADHATRDLFEHIAGGQQAAWEVSVQIMPLPDAETYKWDPFDATKVWSFKDYPRIPIGRMVLNKNPENYFAEVEQVAFSPSNIVPGIGFSPDKLLMGRLFAYPDTQRHRLGTNFMQIPINCPHAQVRTGQRDGSMTVNSNGGGEPNYEPNSTGGVQQAAPVPVNALPVSGVAARTPYSYKLDDFAQAGDLYRLMTEEERARLVHNIAHHMKNVKSEAIKQRQIALFTRCDPQYGAAVAGALGLSVAAATT
jgi:catalase